MRNKALLHILLALAVMAFSACDREFSPAPELYPVPEPVEGPNPAPELVEGYTLHLSAPTAQAIEDGLSPAELFGAIRFERFERLFPDAGEFEQRHRAAGLHCFYRVTLPGLTRTKALESLENIPGILGADPVQPVVSNRSYPDDPYFPMQWGLYNDGFMHAGSGKPVFRAGVDIGVLPVWENYTAGSSEVIVGVLDDGVYHHPDLSASILMPGENGSRNFLDHYSSTPYVMRPGDHGTCVAAIIGAIGGNGKYITGVAGGLDGKGGVRIMDCQFMLDSDDDIEFEGNHNAAMVWAADHGAVILNNSWCYDYSDRIENTPSRTPAADIASIDYFVKYAGTDADGNQTGPMKGGLVVFAAGNDNFSRCQPAMYEGAFTVGAVGPSGERASYSNYGDWVDICAPGGNIRAYEESCGDDAKYAMIITPVANDDEMMLMEGTSMAAPYVCGVAALLVSYYGGPGFTPDDLIEMMVRGADYSFTEQHDKPIGPLVNAAGAFGQKPVPAVPPARVTIEGVGTSLMVEWEVTGAEGMPDYAYNVLVSRYSTMQDAIVKRVVTADRRIGERVSVRIDGLLADTPYFVRIDALSVRGPSAPSEVYPSGTGSNTPPQLSKSFSRGAVECGSTLRFNLAEHFSDPDGDPLAYLAKSDNDNVTLILRGSNLMVEGFRFGFTQVTVSATDPSGDSASASFEVFVRNPGNDLYDIYPVPVQTVLNIRPVSAELLRHTVRITDYGGVVVHEDSFSASVFAPATVDMSTFAPGSYAVEVSGPDGSLSIHIVKI